MKTALLIGIIAALVALAIPFIIALIQFVRTNIKNKNVGPFINFVLNMITEAEKLFSSGAEKKQWVVGMVNSASNTIGYKLDTEKLGQLIDDLVAMTKQVNPPSIK